MTNEKKVKELYQKWCNSETIDGSILRDLLREMAEWKDKQMKSTLVEFMGYLNKREFFCDDLCFDTEHQVDTFIELQNKNR